MIPNTQVYRGEFLTWTLHLAWWLGHTCKTRNSGSSPGPGKNFYYLFLKDINYPVISPYINFVYCKSTK